MTAKLVIDDGDVRIWLGDVIDGLRAMPDELARYREALEKIESMKHVRRAYRHTKYEELIRIAQEALRGS